MKKNILLFFAIAVTLLCLIGCSHSSEAEVDTTEEDTTIPDTTETDTTAPEDTTAPVHSHSYTCEKIAPTCTESGYFKYTCACGDSFSSPTVAATGHDYEFQEVKADCINEGFQKFTCKICGFYFRESFVKATGHSYVKGETVAPTVTSQGYTVYTCSLCNHSYNGDVKAKLPDPNAPKPTVPATPVPPAGEISGTSFDDCVFLGDSVSDMLEIYNNYKRIFGNATFLTETSYSLHNYVKNGYGVTYNGVKMAPEDAIALSGKKKVFIMLGTNDLVWANLDNIVSNYAVLVSRIRAKCPDVQIIIQSQTPVYTYGQSSGLTNVRVNEYNEKLKVFAAQNGCHFVDVGTPLKDSTGGMALQYSSDKYVHINGSACLVWHATLKAFLGMS